MGSATKARIEGLVAQNDMVERLAIKLASDLAAAKAAAIAAGVRIEVAAI